MTLTLSDNERAALREEVKREVKAEMHREERARFWRHLAIRLVIYALFVGVPMVYLASAAARTGLFRVPLLSARLYQPVAPTRLVTPLVGSNAEVVWREVLASAKTDRLTGDTTIAFNEVQLTTVVREGAIAQTDALPFKVIDPQLVLQQDRAELYFQTERDGARAPVLLAFIPSVTSRGALSITVTEAKLGGEAMPGFIRDSMAKLLNSFLANEFSAKMPPGFIWRRLIVDDDSLKVVFTAP